MKQKAPAVEFISDGCLLRNNNKERTECGANEMKQIAFRLRVWEKFPIFLLFSFFFSGDAKKELQNEPMGKSVS